MPNPSRAPRSGQSNPARSQLRRTRDTQGHPSQFKIRSPRNHKLRRSRDSFACARVHDYPRAKCASPMSRLRHQQELQRALSQKRSNRPENTKPRRPRELSPRGRPTQSGAQVVATRGSSPDAGDSPSSRATNPPAIPPMIGANQNSIAARYAPRRRRVRGSLCKSCCWRARAGYCGSARFQSTGRRSMPTPRRSAQSPTTGPRGARNRIDLMTFVRHRSRRGGSPNPGASP